MGGGEQQGMGMMVANRGGQRGVHGNDVVHFFPAPADTSITDSRSFEFPAATLDQSSAAAEVNISRNLSKSITASGFILTP